MVLTVARAAAGTLGFGLMLVLIGCFLMAAFFILLEARHVPKARLRCCRAAGVDSADRWTGGATPALHPAAFWLSECLLTLLLPWIALGVGVAVATASDSASVPAALLALCLPQLLRVKVLEQLDLREIWRLQAGQGEYSTVGEQEQQQQQQQQNSCRCCRSLLECLSAMWRAAASALEVVDATSDGLAVAKAFFLSSVVRRRFSTSWSVAVWPLGPLVAKLGPGAAMTLSLFYTTFCQLGAVLTMIKNQQAAVAFTDFCGAGRLAQQLERLSAKVSRVEWWTVERSIAMSAARSFTENALQLLLQTSIIAATGRGLVADPLLAGSVFLSYSTLFLKWCGLVADMFKSVYTLPETEIRVVFALTIPAVFSLGTLLAYLAVKLYFIHACDSHEW
eukprot:CAMPEP_0178414168 /NCGR_PEP_ID=MMETSP0689_2-20121128/22897_1 /TAXON_ID=160604 /ORGANISM="Amphidinium massartii, Strain CS-259" /LENGTH=392 /DNA_ID=CAMNT_0020035449 /DNA_START=51 /DNA_END=1226 /DNA_ORIENTATION=+